MHFYQGNVLRLLSAFIILAFFPALVLANKLALKVLTERPHAGGKLEIHLKLLGDPANELTVHANHHLYNLWTETKWSLKFLSVEREESETPEEAHLFFEISKDLKIGKFSAGPDWVVRATSMKGELMTETFSFEILPAPREGDSDAIGTTKTTPLDSSSPSHAAPKSKGSSAVPHPLSWPFENPYPQQMPVFDRAPML